MSRTRAERRFLDFLKARRKRKICLEVYWDHEDWYDNLHQYSKNKIHCSCPICSHKTKNKNGYGPKKCWLAQDRKRIDEMDYEIKEFE